MWKSAEHETANLLNPTKSVFEWCPEIL